MHVAVNATRSLAGYLCLRGKQVCIIGQYCLAIVCHASIPTWQHMNMCTVFPFKRENVTTHLLAVRPQHRVWSSKGVERKWFEKLIQLIDCLIQCLTGSAARSRLSSRFGPFNPLILPNCRSTCLVVYIGRLNRQTEKESEVERKGEEVRTERLGGSERACAYVEI